jgi:hypothetical protein
MRTVYTDLCPLTKLQQKIVRYIDYWVHTEKTPISQKRIIEEMEYVKENRKTVIHALDGLLKNGYIRRAITNGIGEDGVGAEKTKYVQLKSL